LINAASKILLHVFLPDIGTALSGLPGAETLAVSPVSILDSVPSYDGARIDIDAGTGNAGHRITAWFLDFGDDMRAPVTRFAENLPTSLRKSAGLLLKKKLQVRAVFRVSSQEIDGAVRERCAEIRMLGRGNGKAPSIRVCLPLSSLGLISRSLCSIDDEESLEKGLVDYFCEPSVIFPDLGTLLDMLDNREIQDLFYRLQRNRLLSTYQICLILAAFPEHSPRVRRCLSANTASDVTDMMRSLKRNRSVTRRDLAGGIYSVEESIYRLMVRGEDFGHAQFLRAHREMVTAISDMETLLRFDFATWLERMEENGLLYHTLAAAGDREVARAIAGTGVRTVSLIERNLSAKKASEIAALAEVPGTMDERIAARCGLVRMYRGLRVRQRNWGAESFEYLLRCVSNPPDFRRILMEAGWFTISTALKGAGSAAVTRITDHFPAPARFLIEDVLRGVVNPNIIHDELQVDAARKLCVKTMLALEEEGAIALESC